MTSPASGELGDLTGLRLLLGVSSSISAYRALDVASTLRKSGAEVRAVMTEHATRLVSPAAFDAITHQRTITTLWGSDHAGAMDHLAATKWATAFALVPATANTLATAAHGIAHDALGTLLLAWNKAPLLIAPAMNPEMWLNAAVQANVATLRARGHQFVGPAEGRMACDDVGVGRLASVEEICRVIAAMARRGHGPLAGRRVLITAGPTREFADDVRCITNPSTGLQGMALAEAARDRGARVLLILGPTPLPPPGGLDRIVRVESADDMLAAVRADQDAHDLLIFSAAVSDWRPAERIAGKEKKSTTPGEVTLKLTRTPDIAATAHQHRRPAQVFVGFAAESENLETYAGEKMQRKGFAIVFANPINREGAGFGAPTNEGLLLRANGTTEPIASASKRAIAERLLDEVDGLLAQP